MSFSKECLVNNRQFKIDTGKLANQAESSVTVSYGDTVVLVTTCIGSEPHEPGDMVRLTIDYEERHYAVGKIPGSFIRREGRPSEQATLSARMTDRSLRPLLSKEIPYDIQIIITVLSTDQENAPDVVALVGASASLANSSIPFAGPVGAVRVGYIDNEIIINPPTSRMNESLIDVIVASTRDRVVMVEASAQQAPEDLVLKAIRAGHEANQEIIKLQEGMQSSCGKPKFELQSAETPVELAEQINSDFGETINFAISQPDRDKREELKNQLVKKAVEDLKEVFQEAYSEAEITRYIESQLKKMARKNILQSRHHMDGREQDQIRPLSSEVGVLPRTHGSGLFSRGRTQVLTITTLGSPRQEQMIDGLGVEDTKRFMHHYNFPPFSTGEVKRIGSPGRREIGHGALAEKALAQVIPSEEDFSYTIRLVSEVLSSNGSTSMASVCASTLSLMDAGVPIKAPVAGIAMGLVTGENGEIVVLTDIEGMEDAYGDMDFKVAGTSKGITAIQMDTKLHGLPGEVFEETLNKARDARLFILDNMAQAIANSRAELSPYAPRQYKMNIDPSKIGALIGPGGKTIRSIIDETKVTIDVEDSGTVIIGSPNDESAKKAMDIIDSLTRDVEVGTIYTGKVTRITNFGAFVEILPGKEGLVHISEMADYRVNKVEDIAKVGDELTVKVIEIDNMGRINLSRRAVLGGDSSDQEPGGHSGGSKGAPHYNQSRPHSHPRGDGSYKDRPFNRPPRDVAK
jgi:polyribonucleotide nucleotidyltransferase